MVVLVEGVRVDLEGTAALAPVSFSLAGGRCLTVVGENGSGKTTLLRVLAGLQPPTEGAAQVHGRPCDERDARFRREVAAHVGPPPTARDLTLQEHLRLVAQTWGTGAEEAARLVEDLLVELGMGSLADRFPHQLSTGQTQLFALALVLGRPATVLVLDEPEHGLDDARVDTVIAALRARVAAGSTVIMATHDSRFVTELGDELLQLRAA